MALGDAVFVEEQHGNHSSNFLWLYGSMGFKQPPKKIPEIYMLGLQLDAAVASPDHLNVDFWYANVPAQVNFKAIHHHH